jgi:hypothetical protein
MQDLSPATPEEEEAWQKMAEEQQQQNVVKPYITIAKADDADNEPQSFWNHRVVRIPDPLGENWFEIQEVYYNKKGEPCGYCNSYVGGETMAELEEQIERHTKALALPTLDSATDFNHKWDEDYEKEL